MFAFNPKPIVMSLNKLKKTFSLSRQIKSFGHAFNGLWCVVKEEHNMHVHLVATIFIVILGSLCGLSIIEWCLIAFAIGMVLMAETFNTSIEVLVDLVSPDYHPLAGKAKDIAAGAVVIACVVAVVIGALIFMPKLMFWV